MCELTDEALLARGSKTADDGAQAIPSAKPRLLTGLAKPACTNSVPDTCYRDANLPGSARLADLRRSGNSAMPLAQESNRKSLEAAVETAAEFLNSKGKCAIVAGVKVRSCHAEDALVKLANATQYPVTGELASPTTEQAEPRASVQNPQQLLSDRHWSHDLCTRVDSVGNEALEL